MRVIRRRKKRAPEDMPSVNALHDATENLIRVKKRDEEVRQVTQELRLMRERNHFAEQLEHLMGRKHA